MSASSVKMLAVVDGEPVEIGRCHPGQARLLRKKGLAEWKDGKVWLKQVPDWREQYIDSALHAATHSLMAGHNHIIGPPPAPGDLAPLASPPNLDDPIERAIHEAREKLLRGEGVELLAPGTPDEEQHPIVEPACQTAQEFFTWLSKRKKLSHDLIWTDDPMSLLMGVDDVTTGERCTIKLKQLKALTAEDVAPFKLDTIQAALRSPEGKRALLAPRRVIEDVGTEVFRFPRPQHPPTPENLAEAGVSVGGGVPEDMFQRCNPWPKDVVAPSLAALLDEYKQRLALSHEMWSCDDPKARQVGFMDVTVNEHIKVPLPRLKDHSTNIGECLGLSGGVLREALCTVEGRKKLFGESELEHDEGVGADLPEIDPVTLWGEINPEATDDPSPIVGKHAVEGVVVKFQSIEAYREHIRSGWRPYKPMSHPGWTSFRWPGCEAALPVFTPEGKPSPEECAGEITGLYRRHKNRLFRIWASQPGCVVWDESVLQENHTYLITGGGTVFEGRQEMDPMHHAVNSLNHEIEK